jgi:hypothetical protein
MIARKMAIWVTAGLLLVAVSCADSNIDNGDTANVVLEVDTVEITLITSTFDPLFNVCVFQITESTSSLSNVPKTEGAIAEPFNDILITSLTIGYDWDDGATTLPSVTSPRVVIPAGSSNQVTFLAIPLDDLAADRAGHSAEVTLLFEGEVADGSRVQAVGGGVLIINSCLVVPGP